MIEDAPEIALSRLELDHHLTHLIVLRDEAIKFSAKINLASFDWDTTAYLQEHHALLLSAINNAIERAGEAEQDNPL